jgi:hypothetical protein
MYEVMHYEMYNKAYGVMYAEMYAKMCSTVFNRECRTKYNICKPVHIQQCDTYDVKEYNIYETSYSQQIHTYISAMEQCRDVDEQVGITMTHLAYGWDGGKQMQIVVYDQRDMPKEMQNMYAGFRGQGMLDKRDPDQDQPIQYKIVYLLFVWGCTTRHDWP